MEELNRWLCAAARGEPDWQALERAALGATLRAMADTPQNPVYHAEGDVYQHTKLVCRSLVELSGFQNQEESMQRALILAALLHDVGKIPCTRWEDERWTSPNHAPTGARMARQMLWQEFSLGGTPETLALRELVCNLIRYHSTPPYAAEDADGMRRLRRIAANGALIPGFTVERLCLLSQADALGRISVDAEDMRLRVQLCEELAKEAACFSSPYPFPTAHTRRAYLSGRNVLPDQPLYDDSWGEVILLSGLPGTGKDTWIKENCPDMPVVSLDQIRREMGISPEENQTPVVDAGRERARQLLRAKQSFVWNATNLSPMVRGKQIQLFEDYHAAVRLVYLETPWRERVQRNQGRAQAVPEQAVCRMMENLVLPECGEAAAVQWQCV